jgi:hypothetical protein
MYGEKMTKKHDFWMRFLVCLNLFDVLSTLLFYGLGVEEANGFILFFLNHGNIYFVVIKMLGIAAVMLYMLDKSARGLAIAPLWLWKTACCIYALIVANNLFAVFDVLFLSN